MLSLELEISSNSVFIPKLGRTTPKGIVTAQDPMRPSQNRPPPMSSACLMSVKKTLVKE